MENTLTPAPRSKRAATAVGLVVAGVGMLLVSLLFLMNARDTKGADKKDETKLEQFDLEKKLKDKEKENEAGWGVKVGDRFYGGVWAVGLGIALIALGGWLYTRTPVDAAEDAGMTRCACIVAGGIAGILTFLLGGLLIYEWSDKLVEWLDGGKRKEAKWTFYGLATLVAGLVMMFFSLQPAKRDLRNNAGLRRLYYGFSAAMAALFLLVLLVGVNVYTGMKWKSFVDTTEKNFFSLQERSKEVIRGLDTPVKAYLVLMPGDEILPDLEALLDNAAAESKQFTYTVIDPRTQGGLKEFRKLHERLRTPEAERGELGLILTMGPDESRSVVIKRRELSEDRRGPRGGEEALLFNGEGRIMAELVYLGEGGKPPIVYFLQGNGELEIGAAPTPPGAKNDLTPDRQATQLEKYLKERKFDVRPLKIEDGKTLDVDPNAVAIVALAPNRPYDEATVKFLREYLKPTDTKRKAGRLLAVLPPVKSLVGNAIAATGLEELLNEYGVEVFAERIIHQPTEGLPMDYPIVIPSRDMAGSPLVRAIWMEPAPVPPSRHIRPSNALPEGMRPKRVFVTTPDLASWFEKNYNVDNEAVFKKMAAGDRELAMEKRAARQGVPVALAASDGPPSAPGLPPPDPSEIKPKLGVIGFDAFNDQMLRTSRIVNGEEMLTFFGGMLDWLRDKPTLIGIEPREHKLLALPRDSGHLQTLLLSALLMIGSIVGIGLGIWVVRRK